MDRNFLLAFTVSILWHVFLGTLFVVDISVKPSEKLFFSKINFLGPLLLEMEDVNKIEYLDGNSKSVPREGSILDRNVIKYSVEGDIEVPNFGRVKPKDKTGTLSAGYPRMYMKDLPELNRDELFFLSDDNVDYNYYKPTSVEILGPVSVREILYQPELPDVFKESGLWGGDSDLDRFELTVRFSVDSSGKVQSIEKVSSSGSTQIDMLGINYVKMCKFAELPKNDGPDGAGQFGELKMSIKRKR